MYLPSIPFFALLVAALQFGGAKLVESWPGTMSLNARKTMWRATAAMACCVAIVGYGSATVRYLPVWQNDTALWSYTSQQAPGLAVVQIQLAINLHNRGLDDEAIEVLYGALESCQPDRLDRERIHKVRSANGVTRLPVARN